LPSDRSAPSIVGFVYDGEPFDAQTWSGCSRFFFEALARQGCLRAAFGAKVGRAETLALRALTFHPDLAKWKFRAGGNVARASLRTRDGLRKLATLDADSYDTILQFGAFYDFTRRPGKRTVSYNDTNLQSMVTAYPERADLRSSLTRSLLRYESQVFENTDVLFTMSRWCADTFVRDLGIDAAKVEPIGAGMNLAEMPDVSEKRYDEANILFVGRDFARKGGQVLLQAFEGVRRALPHATLTLIGAKDLHELPDGVDDLGFVSKRSEAGIARINAAYARASVFVLPSIWEPFGISVLEAQAYGLPCVGTEVGALPELITEADAGLVVPRNDAASLAAALLRMLRDPVMCAQMGSNGRRRQQEYYTWDGVARRIRERLT